MNIAVKEGLVLTPDYSKISDAGVIATLKAFDTNYIEQYPMEVTEISPRPYFHTLFGRDSFKVRANIKQILETGVVAPEQDSNGLRIITRNKARAMLALLFVLSYRNPGLTLREAAEKSRQVLCSTELSLEIHDPVEENIPGYLKRKLKRWEKGGLL